MLSGNKWKAGHAFLLALLAVGPAWADSSDSKAKADIAAYINGDPISLSELDEVAIGGNMTLAQSLYDARYAALDQIILNRALGKEAAEQNMSVDDFIAKRVAEKITPVSDEEVSNFYNQNQNRMGGRTLEQMSDQIKSYLGGNRERMAREALIKEVKDKQTIKVVLDPPRVKMEVAANEPSKGPADAKVTIIEFSEFQ